MDLYAYYLKFSSLKWGFTQELNGQLEIFFFFMCNANQIVCFSSHGNTLTCTSQYHVHNHYHTACMLPTYILLKRLPTVLTPTLHSNLVMSLLTHIFRGR